MAESTPPRAGDHIVRAYPTVYAQSDTESERYAQFEVDTEDAEQHSIATRLKQNQQYLGQQITQPSGESSAWILEPQTWNTNQGSDVILIRKPTASNLSHRLLHPFIYRNIKDAGTLDDLAALLDTPDDWEERYNQVVRDGIIFSQMYHFRDLAEDTPESDIQIRFSGLVSNIADRLRLLILSGTETKIIVGGILSRYQYDLRSKTDPNFRNLNGQYLIASEAKSHRTFGPGELWYHGSRGVQVLSALYAFNCPTFLFTQKQWKLFVENSYRNAVLTFPYNEDSDQTPYANSSLACSMGTTFLKCIVICLLSRRVSLNGSRKAAKLRKSSHNMGTPKTDAMKAKGLVSAERPKRRSVRLQKAADLNFGKQVPSFVSGYAEGQPIYTAIRVVPQDDVARIEDEIAVQEKNGYQNQTSELTLCDAKSDDSWD